MTTDYLSPLFDKKGRAFYMGVGMIMVVLYHLWLYVDDGFVWKAFKAGYVGVDIFMFLSGYGLCFSLKGSDLKSFYRKRVVRILPLFWIMVTCILILQYLRNVPMTVFDGVACYLTLSYWGIGNVMFGWYLSFLVFLYLIFPALNYICERINATCLLFISLLALFALLIMVGFDWQIECGIARLPIVLLGALCYRNKAFILKRGLPIFALFLLVSLPLYMKGYITQQVVFFMAAPFVMVAVTPLYYALAKYLPLAERAVSGIGNNSLEIYVGNSIVVHSLYWTGNIGCSTIVYLVLTALVSLVMVYANKAALRLMKG